MGNCCAKDPSEQDIALNRNAHYKVASGMVDLPTVGGIPINSPDRIVLIIKI